MRKATIRKFENREWTDGHPVIFHAFGLSYEDFGEAGPAPYSVAIVEFPDGKVELVPAEHVTFDTPTIHQKAKGPLI